ncbi:hypothetical protein HCN44_005656 [Aphidius gifuensis]|uniref:Symplekin n=1 Tax=Aphidius gifuensis TaxID=684658 RepID=A0A835CUV1_APHGI|nr:hypothetical protein HCN44_005656 [Aphidius gifuensis]
MFFSPVVQWLNEASMSQCEKVKTNNLSKIQEVILNKDIEMLPDYIDEVLAFVVDKSAEVRKTICSFIEVAGDKQPDMIPKMLPSLLRLLSDDASAVVKRALRTSGRILRAALKWVASAVNVTPEIETAWGQISTLKVLILEMIGSDNDGIRTQAVKFLEGVVLLQTYPDSETTKKQDDFSLEDIPLTLKIARRRKLEEEAHHVLDELIKFHGSVHVSSLNLMTCMGSLATIAKFRPQFTSNVITALQSLQNDLPPTLTDSQVTSVTKHLKLTLLTLMKCPGSIEFASTIAKQLAKLGAKEQEIMKAYPKAEDIRKMKRRQQEIAAATAAKRIKLETILPDDDDDTENIIMEPIKLPDLVELTETYIVEHLSVEVATDLVMDSMAWVPDTMTTIFQREYQPPGTSDINIQRQTVAKLLSAQIKQAIAKKFKKDIKDDDAVMEDLIKNPTITVAEAKRERKREKDREKEKEAKATLEAEKTMNKSRARVKALKPIEVARPLTNDLKEKMFFMAINRILNAEKSAINSGAGGIRIKLLSTMASTLNKSIQNSVLRYVTDDIKSRMELALSWLYEEYAIFQSFHRRTTLVTQTHEAPCYSYNFILCTIISAIEEMQGKDRDIYLSRVYLESPLITEDAITALKSLSANESRGFAPLYLLKEMVIRRPTKQLIFLNVLFQHCAHEKLIIRDAAIKIVVDLYNRNELKSSIEAYAVLYLSFLQKSCPPELVFGEERGRPNIENHWTESTTKACLSLYLSLIEKHQDLIQELARVYPTMSPDVKRIVLRLVEAPVKSLGMSSPQLLGLVENCPKGSEVLVTRIIHILTDKTTPSVELVTRVRELYQTRVSDVRFLIPVLNGLPKKEVLSALPKLIKLNPVVVKEVFNRLLGVHNNDSGIPHTSPITPADLLIALHTIDLNKTELKTVMKATSLCFAEKQVYTHEVLGVVINNLMEMNPLPTLLMRTVIQSLTLYPKIIGFVMNILQRLILKQVWKQPKVWEGFVKCCERTQPQSFSVILQLPPQQLSEALKMSPELKIPLISHVDGLADNQKAHISASIMDVLQGIQSIDMHDDFDIAPPIQKITTTTATTAPTTITTITTTSDSGDISEPTPPGLE